MRSYITDAGNKNYFTRLLFGILMTSEVEKAYLTSTTILFK